MKIQTNFYSNCFVDIRIYNPSGQLVTVLASQKQSVGEHEVTWNAKNNNGLKLSSGIYICSIIKGNSVSKKEILYIY